MTESWLNRLEMLLIRFSHLGISSRYCLTQFDRIVVDLSVPVTARGWLNDGQ